MSFGHLRRAVTGTAVASALVVGTAVPAGASVLSPAVTEPAAPPVSLGTAVQSQSAQGQGLPNAATVNPLQSLIVPMQWSDAPEAEVRAENERIREEGDQNLLVLLYGTSDHGVSYPEVPDGAATVSGMNVTAGPEGQCDLRMLARANTSDLTLSGTQWSASSGPRPVQVTPAMANPYLNGAFDDDGSVLTRPATDADDPAEVDANGRVQVVSDGFTTLTIDPYLQIPPSLIRQGIRDHYSHLRMRLATEHAVNDVRVVLQLDPRVENIVIHENFYSWNWYAPGYQLAASSLNLEIVDGDDYKYAVITGSMPAESNVTLQLRGHVPDSELSAPLQTQMWAGMTGTYGEELTCEPLEPVPTDADDYDPGYENGTVQPGESVTVEQVQETELPEDTTFAVEEGYEPPEGYEVEVDPDTGSVTVTAPDDAEPGTIITVPVVLTYPDGSTETVEATVVVEPPEPFADQQDPGYEPAVTVPGGTVELPQVGDDEMPEGTTYSIDPEDAPEGWTVEIDPDTGLITATAPEDAQPGDEVSIPVTVTYADGSSETVDATITVVEAPQADVHNPGYTTLPITPAASVTSPQNQDEDIPEGTQFAIQEDYTPPEGYEASIDPETGAVTLTAPEDAEPGTTITVPVLVTYPDGTSDVTFAQFTVVEVPQAEFYEPSYEPTETTPGTPVDVAQTGDENVPGGSEYSIDPGDVPEGWTAEVDPETGTVTVTPPEDAEPGDSITVPVTITYPDGSQDTTDVTVTVVDTEEEPDEDIALTPIEDQTITVGESIDPVTVETDGPVDSVTVEGLPEGVTFDPENNLISGIPDTPGTYEVTVTATGEDGTTVTETFTITVTEDEDPEPSPEPTDPEPTDPEPTDPEPTDPEPVEDTTMGPLENQVVTLGDPITETTVSVDGPYSSLEAEGLPPGVTFDPETGTFSGTPTELGTFPVIVTAYDEDGNPLANTSFYITVVPTEDPGDGDEDGELTIGPIGNQTVEEGSPIDSIEVDVNDPEAEITVEGLPEGVTFDPETRTIAGTPTAPGTYEVTMTATDGENTVTETFIITVTPTGSPEVPEIPEPSPEPTDPEPTDPEPTEEPTDPEPSDPAGEVTVEPIDDQTINEGESITPIQIVTDGPVREIVVTGLPDGVTFDPETGTISGTPTQTGSFPITVTVIGEDGSRQSVTFTLTVNPIGEEEPDETDEPTTEPTEEPTEEPTDSEPSEPASDPASEEPTEDSSAEPTESGDGTGPADDPVAEEESPEEQPTAEAPASEGPGSDDGDSEGTASDAAPSAEETAEEPSAEEATADADEDQGGLASTGAAAAWIAGIGLLVMAAGAALVAVRHRRRGDV